MPICLLGIGSNLGDRHANLQAAVGHLDAHAAIQTVRVSRWIATAPLGGPDGQPEFLNGAVRIQTSLTPLELLDVTQQIEYQLGRRREVHWDARPIDIDILLFDDLVCEQSRLIVPHPWLAVRRFVLQPAAELGGEVLHPQLGWTFDQLYDHALNALPRFAVCGATLSEWQQLEARFHKEFGARAVTIAAPESRSASEPSDRWLQQHLDRLDAAGWNDEAQPSDGDSPLVLSAFWPPQIAEQAGRAGLDRESYTDGGESAWDNAVASAKLVIEVVQGRPPGGSVSRPMPNTDHRVRTLIGFPAICPHLRVADRGTLSWIDQVIAAIKMMHL